MHGFEHFIVDYSYPGLFVLLALGIVGLPIPDETLLAFAGYLVFQDKLSPGPTLLAAFLGSACGISLSYFLGRLLGLKVLHRHAAKLHLTEEQLLRAHAWFQRVGKWTLPAGYFIPGVRHLTAFIAGASELDTRVFVPFAYAGALIWSLTFLAAGYFFGKEWEKVAERLHGRMSLLVICAAAAILIWYLLKRFLKHRSVG